MGHWTLLIKKISDLYLLRLGFKLKNENKKILTVGVCCCLQTCKSVLNMLMMGSVLRQSLMVISTAGILLCAIVSPLYNVLCCCLHVNYIVYKHFDRSLQVRSLDPTCVQNFRPTVFEILGFKLKNKNRNNKNWRNRLFATSPMLWSNSHQNLGGCTY